MPACSDSTDSNSSAGAAGSPAASGGSGGKGSAGAMSEAGSTSDAGEGGGTGCAFVTDACQTCLQEDQCKDEVAACGADTTCADAVSALPNCVCNPANSALDCQTEFITNGGDKAQPLAVCSIRCQAACL